MPLKDVTVAVFADGEKDFIIVHLEADKHESEAAGAVARGYRFIGSIAIIDGAPTVSIEPNEAHTMSLAGLAFAEFIGPIVKQHQTGA